MVKKLTNRKVILISATVMVVVLALGFTLALWSRNFTQTGTNTIASDCFDIQYSETDATGLVNAYPQTDADGLKNVPYTVTIENTCDTIATYNVVLNELSTNTLSESHVKVAVNDSYKMLNTYDSATPSADVENATSARKLTSGILPGNATRSISVKSWMDEATTELEGENKAFGYKITIETSAGTNKILAAEILKTPLTTTAIDYSALPVSGLYAANDNDGESYFYRGNIDNNYVDLGLIYPNDMEYYVLYDVEGYGITSYSNNYEIVESWCTNNYSEYYESVEECMEDIKDYSVQAGDSMLFRIVRINGDGTIRLISDGPIGTSAYNTTYNSHKYAGYTFDNTSACTNANPCTSASGTSSTIKTYLENWYTANIASTTLNNKIATTTYCNDTSYTVSGSRYDYGAYTRIEGLTPSLVCPNTEVTYGGTYKLKVGLPSADEVNMAGYGYDYGSYEPDSNYMFKMFEYPTGSPVSSRSIEADLFSNYPDGSVSNGYLYNESYYVRPVINLVADAKVSSGNGTKSSPYVIDLN